MFFYVYSISPILEKHQALLLMFLGFGGLSITLGITHYAIRKYVYHDSHGLDTVFDAGGKVTLGLTAVTVTSQMLWPADFLQSATIMSKVTNVVHFVNLFMLSVFILYYRPSVRYF
jgi:hypothetical protein